jgi:hypothetical protein
MTNTLRATTVQTDSAVQFPNHKKHNRTFLLSAARLTHSKAANSIRQDRPVRDADRQAIGVTVRRPAPRRTFAQILESLHPANIRRLKDRAFKANSLAKTTVGRSRDVCYQLKNRSINTLLRHGAANLCTLECSFRTAELGIVFAGGGRLHTLPSALDRRARAIIQQQLALAFTVAEFEEATYV